MIPKYNDNEGQNSLNVSLKGSYSGSSNEKTKLKENKLQTI
jgi:hypothetical protein